MTGAKRGRPRKAVETIAEQDGALTVKVANAIHDGKGGFMPVGSKTIPTDDEARASLIAKGLAE
jgi:hypothetical protein